MGRIRGENTQVVSSVRDGVAVWVAEERAARVALMSAYLDRVLASAGFSRVPGNWHGPALKKKTGVGRRRTKAERFEERVRGVTIFDAVARS